MDKKALFVAILARYITAAAGPWLAYFGATSGEINAILGDVAATAVSVLAGAGVFFAPVIIGYAKRLKAELLARLAIESVESSKPGEAK